MATGIPGNVINHSDTPPASAAPRSGFYRNLLWSTVFDAVCPYLVYRFASPHMSQASALCWTLVPPAFSNAVTLLRKRRLDIVGVIVILGTAAGLMLFLFGGSPRLMLVRESFITGIVGLVFLGSLLFHRPFCYYVARQFITNNDPERVARFDRQYDQSKYKFGMPQMTVVWGVVLVGEAVLRTIMALYMPISLFLAVYNFLFIGIYAVAMVWSYFYGYRMYARDRENLENS